MSYILAEDVNVEIYYIERGRKQRCSETRILSSYTWMYITLYKYICLCIDMFVSMCREREREKEKEREKEREREFG